MREQDAWLCMVEVRSSYSQSYPLSQPFSFPSLKLSKLTYGSFLTAIFGPAATRWFQFLQEKIVLKNKNLEILARVVVDQSLFTPVNLGCFLSSMAYMEGVPIKEKIDKSYKTAITANWSIWPFIQMVNFKFVPLPHRVLFVNTISIGWNCFLSMINSAGNEEFGVEGKDI